MEAFNFQQLYNIADSFAAGKFVGEDALAAVGNSYEITLIASGVLCAVLMILGLGFCGSLLNLINTPDSVMAGYSAAIKLNNLVVTSLTTLGNGVSNYTAQNIGAGKLPRIREGFRAGLKLVWLLCLPLFLLYFFAGRWLLLLFLQDKSGTAMEVGVEILHILSPFYLVVASKLVADGILRGSGMMGKFMVDTFSDLILRVVLAYVLPGTALGTTGIWLAWPVGWTVATMLSVCFYRTGLWFGTD